MSVLPSGIASGVNNADQFGATTTKVTQDEHTTRGTTALVTGATSNIGRAIATAFAAEGARVIVSGRNPRRGAEVLVQIHGAGGHAGFIAADLDGSAHPSQGLAADATRAL